jgi:acetylornithine deacetylase/succinyl-diaminopimelate desuccinylase-like protein
MPPLATGKYAKDLPDSAAQLLSRYIQIPSVSGMERDAALFLMEEGLKAGLHGQWLKGPAGEPNLVLSLFPLVSGKPNCIFIHHMDVVPGLEDASWRYPPFSGTLAEGHVWGRGAYDNKGPGIATLLALKSLVEEVAAENWSYNVSLLAVVGEETFSDAGAAYVAEHYHRDLNPLVIFGEGPVGLTNVTQRRSDTPVFSVALTSKRVLWVRLTAEYDTNGHGSAPPSAYPTKDLTRALHRVLKTKQPYYFSAYNANLLSAVGDQESGFKGFLMKNIHVFGPLATPFLRKDPLFNSFFSNTISLTEVSSNSAVRNSIPQKAEAILDCRLLPQTNKDEFMAWLQKKIRDDRIRLEIMKETPNARPTSTATPQYDAILKTIRHFHPKSHIAAIMLPATNDSNYFRAKGYPVYCFVPFVMEPDLLKCVHAPDERLPYRVLEEGVKMQTFLIRELVNIQHGGDTTLK